MQLQYIIYSAALAHIVQLKEFELKSYFCVISADCVGSEMCSLPPDVGQSERGEFQTSRGARH